MRLRPALVLAGLVQAACAGSKPAPAPVAAPVPPSVTPAASAAVWRYHPRAPAPMLARVQLSDGRSLLAGRRGERWIYDAEARALEAAVPAPEDLVAILGDRSQERVFIGRSGTSYRALTPLGPFVDVAAPFDSLARVSGAGAVLLGVGRDRKLSRSADQGHGWARVGPAGVAFVDVAVDDEGHALALASPEALYQSTDSGQSFQPVDFGARGILGLSRDPGGAFLRVSGVLETRRWLPGPGRFEIDAQPSLDARPQHARPPLGADAGALAEGRALLTGDAAYFEARWIDEASRRYQLLRGPLGGPFEARPLPEIDGCRAVRTAGFERYLFVACFRASPAVSQPVELWASADRARSFARVTPDLYAKLGDFRMVVGGGGALLVSGVCSPSAEGPGCAPAGIHYRRAAVASGKGSPASAKSKTPAAPGFELGVSIAPTLVENALDLAFDAQGRWAYAVGFSSKGSGMALFVSADSGKSFEVRELADAALDSSETEGGGVATLSAGRDGTIALVLAPRRGAATLVVFDKDGHVLRSSNPPERSLLGAAGLSVLAVGLEGGGVWESRDGGASWEAAGRLPIALCPGDSSCDVPLRCTSAGCVVGDELTRLGWGVGDEAELEAAVPVDDDGSEGGFERRFRTPLACTLAASPWTLVPGVRELPGAEESALGDTAWFAVADDYATASATIYHARGGPRPRLDSVPLLQPLRRPSDFALAVIPQVEGAAALRYRAPDPRVASAHLTDVEIVWNNLLEGRVTRARLADGGAYSPGDFERGAGVAQIARPDLVSIAERGLYLRLHARGRDRQATLFLDGSSVVTLPPIPWPGSIPRGGHTEMAHLGSGHVGLALLDSGAALVRARLAGTEWRFDAASIGLPDPDAFGLGQAVHITYLNASAALHVELVDLKGRSSEAHVFPLRAEGAPVADPVAAPVALDLGTRPIACSSPLKRSSARVVAARFPGTSHPVVVTDAVEPPRAFLSGDAVLHGSPKEACLAAFELNPPSSVTAEAGVSERGIVLLDDLEHAWLLRKVRDQATERVRVEYRGMNCRFEPNLEVPEEIQRAAEALAPKRMKN
ncbi:MAG TPA: hypothetical protein VGK73_00815 [Polyangiaceae bacterium]